MGKKVNLTNRRSGKLLVLSFVGHKKGRRMWACLCDCGNIIEHNTYYLNIGLALHCGCDYIKNLAASKTKHGEGNSTKEYWAWISIKQRCYNPNHISYRNYGARGIKVCQRWIDSYQVFLGDMGRAPTPKHSIDRHPDKNGNYEPGNCRWTTQLEQMNNIRKNVHIEYKGETLTQAQWARRLNISDQALRQYYFKKGYSIPEIIKIRDEKGLAPPYYTPKSLTLKTKNKQQ